MLEPSLTPGRGLGRQGSARPHRGQRNESAYLPLVAAKIAELKGIPAVEVARVTTASARTLFRLPQG